MFTTGSSTVIDLEADWSIADIGALLGPDENGRGKRLEVSAEGIAVLNCVSEIPDAAHENALHRFFEIWEQDMDFVSPGATGDKQLCAKIKKILRENHPVLNGPSTLSAL